MLFQNNSFIVLVDVTSQKGTYHVHQTRYVRYTRGNRQKVIKRLVGVEVQYQIHGYDDQCQEEHHGHENFPVHTAK